MLYGVLIQRIALHIRHRIGEIFELSNICNLFGNIKINKAGRIVGTTGLPDRVLKQNFRLNRNLDQTLNVAAPVAPMQHFQRETEPIVGQEIAIHFGPAIATQYPVDFEFPCRIPTLRQWLASGKRPMHLPKNL